MFGPKLRVLGLGLALVSSVGVVVGCGGGGAGTDAGGAGGGEPAGARNSLSVGVQSACDIKSDGTLWCWGANAYGQLGNGSFGPSSVPVQVSTLGTDVVEISAGGLGNPCARKADGTLWCWGTDANQAVPAQVGPLGTSVVEVSSGNIDSCARKTDGTLWCWAGLGSIGDVVQESAVGMNVAQIAVGDRGMCALDTGGTVRCSTQGPPTLGKFTEVSGLGASVAQVAVGIGGNGLEQIACARKTDGTLWCWGGNTLGQLGDGTTNPSSSPVQVSALGADVAQVALGAGHACARKTDGTLWCWGDDEGGELGNGTVSDAANPSPARVSALGNDVAEVAAGGHETCARKTDGSVWCWGDNVAGDLGDGTTTTRSMPVQVHF